MQRLWGRFFFCRIKDATKTENVPNIAFILSSNMDFSAFSKAKDLQKRLLFTLFALIVFRLGTYIPLPGINPTVLNEFFSENSEK